MHANRIHAHSYWFILYNNFTFFIEIWSNVWWYRLTARVSKHKRLCTKYILIYFYGPLILHTILISESSFALRYFAIPYICLFARLITYVNVITSVGANSYRSACKIRCIVTDTLHTFWSLLIVAGINKLRLLSHYYDH